MNPRDLAKLYLEKAYDDEVAATALVQMAEVADSIVGFHAQQAIEKCLKAVLAIHEVRVRKTHDLASLGAQVLELGIALPPTLDDALELTPYSVLERYPLGGELEALDRQGALELVRQFRDWALSNLDG